MRRRLVAHWPPRAVRSSVSLLAMTGLGVGATACGAQAHRPDVTVGSRVHPGPAARQRNADAEGRNCVAADVQVRGREPEGIMQFVSFGVTIENVSHSPCELSGTPSAVALLSNGARLRGVPTTFTGSPPPPKRVLLSARSDASLILGSSAACATFSFRAPYVISVRLLLGGGYFRVTPAPGKPVPTRCGLAVSGIY